MNSVAMFLTLTASVIAGPPTAPTIGLPTAAGLRTISEDELNGSITSISEAGTILLRRPAGEAVRVRLEDVIHATLGPADEVPAPGSAGVLFLATGGRLNGRILANDKAGITFQSPLLGRLKIGFDRLLAYVTPNRTGEPETHAALVKALLGVGAEQDVVHLSSGDRMPGVIEVLTPEKVVISGALGRREYAGKDIQGVAFSRDHLDRRLPETLYARFTFVDGSTLAARLTALAAGKFTLAAAAGFDVTLGADRVHRFDVRNGRTVWLSDLKPARIDTVPYYNRVWPMRRDLSVWGRPLTIARRTYASGIGLAARTTVVYAVDGKYDRLEAEVGIDDETRGKGSALLTITTDGRRAVNRPLKAGQAPFRLNVPLAGVKELVILVDFGQGTDAGDHVDLGDARLIRVGRD